MGHRLSKIYTRTGDKGTTGLGDNTRVAKDNLRVEAFGTLDELNSFLGQVLAYEALGVTVRQSLTHVQHELFDLGGELCLPGYIGITAAHVTRLEQELDGFNEHLPPLREFILPGGHPAAAACHVARAVCRRAERRMVTLSHAEEINPQGLIYLNRLSDLLFVVARLINQETQQGEVMWAHDRG